MNKRLLQKYWSLYLLLLLPIIYFVVFKYVPMAGNILAFRKFSMGDSIFGTKWVGFRYFRLFLKDPYFWKVFFNTLILSVTNLVIGFPIPIIFALLLNEISSVFGKRLVQTISYIPKFLSVVVVISLINIMLSPSGGIINSLIKALGGEAIYFLKEPGWFRPIYIISDIWQFMGWNSILYIAALSNVDPQLYEAAKIDGAGYLKQVLFVTIPGIMPTIVITLILSAGGVLGVGFEKVLLLYSPGIYDTADVLQTYVYRMGLLSSNYSYSTAVGLFQAAINLTIIWTVNRISRKTTETSLW